MVNVPLVSISLILLVFVYLFWSERVKKTKKWIVRGILLSALAAFILANYGFPKDEPSEYVFIHLGLYHKDRGESPHEQDLIVQQVFFLFGKDYTRVLMLCGGIYEPENIDILLLLNSPHLLSFNMDSLEKKTIEIYAFPSIGSSAKEILYKSQDDFEKEFHSFQITYETEHKDMTRCYLDLSPVGDRIREKLFWICFDTEALEFEKQIYIDTYFSGFGTVNLVSLWVDERDDIILSYPPGRPYPDHVNFEVNKEFPECTIKIRKLEILNEAWFVAVFATSLSLLALYFSFREENDDVERIKNNRNNSQELKKDLNKATNDDLSIIRGIDAGIAKRILQNKPFNSWEEVSNIRGIGEKRLTILKENFIIL